MLGVAGFAKIVMENLDDSMSVDKEAVIQACLFHDIAKIVNFTKYFDDEEEIKNDFVCKYGADENIAANIIVAEIPLSENAQRISIINNTDSLLEMMESELKSNNYEVKILKYSDSRTAPSGVVSLKERWEDLVKRRPEVVNVVNVKRISEIIFEYEKQIQQKCKIDLSKITQEQVNDQLKHMLELEF